MKKDARHAMNEYGWKIRHENAYSIDEGKTVFPAYYLIENCFTGKRIKIEKREAIDYLDTQTRDAIKRDYLPIVTTMQILGIKPMITLKEHLQSINKSGYQLALEAGMPKQTVGDLVKGATDISSVKLINAIKLAAALHMTVDELLMFTMNRPYKLKEE